MDIKNEEYPALNGAFLEHFQRISWPLKNILKTSDLKEGF